MEVGGAADDVAVMKAGYEKCRVTVAGCLIGFHPAEVRSVETGSCKLAEKQLRLVISHHLSRVTTNSFHLPFTSFFFLVPL